MMMMMMMTHLKLILMMMMMMKSTGPLWKGKESTLAKEGNSSFKTLDRRMSLRSELLAALLISSS